MSALAKGYGLETDPTRFDRALMHSVLSNSYWAGGLTRERMDRAVDHSLCVAAFHGGTQVGFARVVSDRAHFAWIADVFVLPEHSGKGIARAMVSHLHNHPQLAGVRRFLLVTRDAEGVYEKLGYGVPDDLSWFRQLRPESAWQ
jgi:GNAT superfamily N-acetyltransferase